MMTLDEYILQYYSANCLPRYKSQIEQYKPTQETKQNKLPTPILLHTWAI